MFQKMIKITFSAIPAQTTVSEELKTCIFLILQFGYWPIGGGGPIVCRGEVEDTRLEAKAKDTKKFRGQG